MKIRILTSLLFLLFLGSAFAQGITQNIKGRVIDQQSQIPLPGINVYVEENGTKKGSLTDMDGYYKIETVKSEDIAFFYAQGKHCFLTDRTGTEYLTDKSLAQLMEVLNPRNF